VSMEGTLNSHLRTPRNQDIMYMVQNSARPNTGIKQDMV
jgi:hypothetical protein